MIFLVISIILLFSCSNTARDNLLSGQFGSVDSNPPELISPVDDEKVNSLSTTLVWASKQGATRYTVEVARDADFSQMMPGSPFTTDDSNLKVDFTDAYTWYWRVRANTTEEGKYSEIRKVHPLDAIYVYCPGTESTCSEDTDSDGNSDTVGNKSAPYRLINSAMIPSANLNLPVKVANRDSSNKAYNESISLSAGANVTGGYDNSTWQQGSDRTKIQSSLPQVLSITNIKSRSTEVKYFEIISTSTKQDNHTVYAQNNDDSVTLSSNIIRASINGANNTYAVNNYRSHIKIENNTIYPGANTFSSTYGIYNEESEPYIHGNTIVGGQAPNIYGVYITGKSAAKIISNKIFINQAGNGYSSTYGINNSNSAAFIINNEILYRYSGFTASAIIINNRISGQPRFSTNDNSIFINNNVTNSESGSGLKVLDVSGSAPVISGNTLLRTENTDVRYGISLTSAASKAVIFNNTVFSGATSAGFTGDSGIYINNSAAPVIDNNIIISSGDKNTSRYGVHEKNANADSVTLLNNLFNDNGTAGTFYSYRNEDTTDLQYICSDGKPGSTNGCATGVDVATSTTGGNTTQANFSDLFQYYPGKTVITSNGNGADYSGTTTVIELKDATTCNLFTVGEYFEYMFNETAYNITAKDCSTEMTVSFTPELAQASVEGAAIQLWGSISLNYSQKYALKSTSNAAGAGLSCPGGFSLKTHTWDRPDVTTDYTSQSACDEQYPHSGATHNGGNCETSYLHPAIEIIDDDIGNDNGLCEAGETCLINTNIGADPGYGSLVSAGCDVSGIISNVTLMKYQNNGY